MIDKEEFVGRVAHIAWWSYQMGSELPFNEWPTGEQLKSQKRAAKGYLANPTMSPEENHEMWVADRLAHGWKYGPEKDESRRTHPDLVPYCELTEPERLKDEMDLLARKHASFLWDLLGKLPPEAKP